MSTNEILTLTALILGVFVTIFGCLGGLIAYLYRGNESKAAALIAGKLDNIVEKLDVLFTLYDQQASETKGLYEAQTAIEKTLTKHMQYCALKQSTHTGEEINHTSE